MSKNSKVRWVGIALTVIVIVAGVVVSFVRTEVKAVDTKADGIKEDMMVLKEDGCKPALKNTSSIGLIEYRLDEMQVTQQAIEADTKEILKRLPE